MIREVIALSQGKLPDPDDPQVSPLEAAQLVYEGPAVVVEGGGQEGADGSGRSRNREVGGEDDPSQVTPQEAAQLEYEGPAVSTERGDQGFPSTDLRYRQGGHLEEEEQDKRPASVLVEAINRFSRQGPGGTFDLAGFSSLKHCLLCGKNCTCLSRCMGPPARIKPSVSSKRMIVLPSFFIPGLPDDTSPQSITLTSITKTVSKVCL